MGPYFSLLDYKKPTKILPRKLKTLHSKGFHS
nr:MAG TPA: hypothetical protein [Caudoviricetes sp.]